ncbi:DUF805 domain-containing protein [Dysgonomonas sp. HGC4]|uniref:DUF805 domain-containing protein n=1 Tax=Dysgonomonas sp. HGC4 TaxID=1658009 RepID=UPI0006819B2B|nr:DUF805 domain-containing protein [Dysgonomonas sp. HGC4]MBD8347350.1 DUF805 domain-containing protein [Dysgonomonas sp. HGC4]
MNFNWFLEVVKNKYIKFDGRARREEFWMYYLVYLIIAIVSTIIDSIIGMRIVGSLLSLALLLPTIGVGIRRMHDIGKSGWFILIPLYNIYLWAQAGTPGTNEYGANPKEVSNI